MPKLDWEKIAHAALRGLGQSQGIALPLSDPNRQARLDAAEAASRLARDRLALDQKKLAEDIRQFDIENQPLPRPVDILAGLGVAPVEDLPPTSEERLASVDPDKLPPDKRAAYDRAKKTQEAMRNMRPSQQLELEPQMQQYMDEQRIEESQMEPPTMESEAVQRVITDKNGTFQILQPDGQVDVRSDMAKLKQIEIEGQKEVARMQQQYQQEQQAAADQKTQQDKREQQYKKYQTTLNAETPRSERISAIHAELNRNSKLANEARGLPALYITRARAEAELERRERRDAAGAYRSEQLEEILPSPEERFREKLKDPDALMQEIADTKTAMTEQLVAEGAADIDVTDRDALAEIYRRERELPDMVEGIIEQQREPASPSDLPMAGRQADTAAMLARVFGAGAAGTPAPYANIPADTFGGSPAVEKAEAMLAERAGNPIAFNNIIEDRTLQHFQDQGADNPREAAAEMLVKTMEEGREDFNINFRPTMERNALKALYPLIEAETTENFEAAGVQPGDRYLTPIGEIKQRTIPKRAAAKPVPKKRSRGIGSRTFTKDVAVSPELAGQHAVPANLLPKKKTTRRGIVARRYGG